MTDFSKQGIAIGSLIVQQVPILLTATAKSLTSVVSDSMRPQRRQPTRLPHPWHSPGKNTGVGCHFLLQCMKVKSEREVAQLCPTLSDPMDCSPPGFSIHGIFQARVLEWGAIAFSEYPYYYKIIIEENYLGCMGTFYTIFSTFQ